MGYVNEGILRAERKAYMIPNYKEITPSHWTIDKEKNIKLFDYWTNIDNPSEIYFALVWGEAVIDITLIKHLRDNTVAWNLRGMIIPDDLVAKEKEILSELREAMMVYGVFGLNLQTAKKADIEINF